MSGWAGVNGIIAQDCVPAPGGLDGWWPGDVDASDIASTNHGTLINQAAAGAPGLVGGAFHFDGDYDFAQIPDASELRPAQFTVEAWVNPESLTGEHIVAMYETTTAFNYALVVRADRRPAVYARINGAGWYIDWEQPLQTNQWVHLAGSYDGTWLTLHINGARAWAQIPGSLSRDPGTLGIGGSPGFASDFHGRIDEVSVYGRALSIAEVEANYEAGVQGKCKGPVITVQPLSQTASLSSNASFSVTTRGMPPFTYKWMQNGNPLSDGGRIGGTTTANLSISNLTSGDAGDYRVVVSNQYASVTSSVATLTVLIPPSITSHPADAVVAHGQSAGFNAGASGSLLLYQWQKDGSNLSEGGRYSGTQTPSLTISSAQMSNVGQYRLIVSNAAGVAVTDEASLQVVPVRVWGNNVFGQQNVPLSLTNAVAADAGSWFNLGLRADGSVVSWGLQTTVPESATNVVALAAGNNFSLVLRADGRVVGWGANDNGQVTVPDDLSNVVAIATGGYHSLALKEDGTVVAWGYNGHGQASPPAGLSNVIAISAGNNHSLALKSDGTIVGFGYNYPYGQGQPPAGLSGVVAIASGLDHNLILGHTGTAWAWGDNSYGQCNYGYGIAEIASIDAGHFHSLVLRDPNIFWIFGDNSGGQSTAPPGLTGVVALSGGNFTSLAVFENPAAGSAPQFIGHPFDRTTPKDGVTIFKPYLSGSLPMAYQWFHDGMLMPGPTQPWLYLSGLQTNQSGNYHLVASNRFGMATNEATALTVILVPPTFTQHPQSQTQTLGANVQLSAVASGSTPLSYQWFFNNVELPNQTNTTLNLSPVQTNHAGEYWSVVNNAAGSATSDVATLTVIVPVTILDPPSNQVWLAGSNALLSVEATGTEPITYQWYRGSTPLTDDGRITGATNDELRVTNVLVSDAGSYWVRVQNWANTVDSPQAVATVVSAPYITNQPVNLAVSAGSNAMFAVGAAGTAPLAYQWRSGGTNIPGATLLSVTLTNVQVVDQSNYDVVITNAHGSVTSAVGALTVLPSAPFFLTAPTSRVVSIGQSMQLSAAARGSEPISFQWQLNSVDLSAETNPILAMSSLDTSRQGDYRLVASNNVGVTVSPPASIFVVPIIAWGQTNLGQLPGPILIPAAATNVVRIDAAGLSEGQTSMALRSDGTLVRWGASGFIQDPPIPPAATNVIAFDIGEPYRTVPQWLAVRSDGSALGWGETMFSKHMPPPEATNLVAVTGGAYQSLGLRADGSIGTWGSTMYGLQVVPEGATNIVAIAAGFWHNVALRADGRVIVWGGDGKALETTALSNETDIVAISAQGRQTLGLRRDGTLVGWMVTNNSPQVSYYGPPPANATNIALICAGDRHTLALRRDGTMVGFGNSFYGQTNPPPYATNVVALAAGRTHSLAVAQDSLRPVPPYMGREPANRSVMTGNSIVIHSVVLGSLPLSHQWRKGDLAVPGQTNPWLYLTNVHPRQAGDYVMVASNEFGSVTSAVATVTVAIPEPVLHSQGTTTNGFSFTFETIDNVLYVTEYSDKVTSGPWTELERRFGSGGTETVTDPEAGAATRFYRVWAVFAPSPKLGLATWTGSQVRFTVPTVAGARYVVEYKDSLDETVWMELEERLGTGAVLEIINPGPLPASRFYRVRVR